MFSGMFAVPWDVLVLCSRMMHEFRKASIFSKRISKRGRVKNSKEGRSEFLLKSLFDKYRGSPLSMVSLK